MRRPRRRRDWPWAVVFLAPALVGVRDVGVLPARAHHLVGHAAFRSVRSAHRIRRARPIPRGARQLAVPQQPQGHVRLRDHQRAHRAGPRARSRGARQHSAARHAILPHRLLVDGRVVGRGLGAVVVRALAAVDRRRESVLAIHRPRAGRSPQRSRPRVVRGVGDVGLAEPRHRVRHRHRRAAGDARRAARGRSGRRSRRVVALSQRHGADDLADAVVHDGGADDQGVSDLR